MGLKITGTRHILEVAAGRFIALDTELPSRDTKLHRAELASLEPIFLLSIYNDQFFVITDVLDCEQGWTIDRLPTGMDANESTSERYVVTKEKWNDFEKFIRLCEEAFKLSSGWRPLEIARRHYLTATFASENPFVVWAPGLSRSAAEVFPEVLDNARFSTGSLWCQDSIITFENVLLHYISTIEAIVAIGLNTEKRYIASRCARLVGRNDIELRWISKFLGDAYLLRNKLIHGDEPHPSMLSFDLRKLRRICQRAIAITLGLIGDGHSDRETGDFLRTLDTSAKAQTAVEKTRTMIYGLIPDSSPLNDGEIKL